MGEKKDTRNIFLLLATGIFLLCGTLLFGGVVTTYIRKFNRILEEENRVRMAETGENIRTYMNAVVDNNRSLLQNTAEALMVIPQKDRMSYLRQVQEQDYLVYIGYAGKDGMLYTTLSAGGKDISEESYFKKALSGKYVVTGIVREILKDSAASGVILAVPLPDGQGIVAAMVDLRQLETALETSSFGGQGYSYIIDREGNLVLYKRSMDYYNFFNLLDNVTFEEGFSHDAILNDIMEEQAGLSCYSNFSVKQYAYYCPLGINDWTVVSIVAKDVVTQKTDALVYELIRLCTVTVAVFLVLILIVVVLYNQSQNRKKADQAKSVFLANMSHDIRTPMNAIIGMTTIAKRHLEDTGRVKTCLDKIESSSKYLLGLINDVLDMSKIESGKMILHREAVLLPDVIDQMIMIVQPLIKAKNQDFSIRRHQVEHERIYTDSLRLSQVFVNILSNASKFTPEGGRITVDIEELRTDAKEMSSYRFVFSDTGIGMSPEFTKDIFSAFSREQDIRKNGIEGTGLGMAISKKIVDEMNGKISVKSQLGKGTVFTVELKFQLDHSGQTGGMETEPDAVGYDFKGFRFLLVEDNELNREIAVELLSELGAEVETACNGAEGVSSFEKFPSGYYTLILMDIQMPVMDGYTAARKIRRLKRPDAETIPIIAMTANAFAEDVAACMEAGMNAHLAKPLDMQKVQKTIQAYIS